MQFLDLPWWQQVSRGLMTWLSEFIYSIMGFFYELFNIVTKTNILNAKDVQPIYQRVTMILTIVMVFYITFQFVKYVVQPDSMTDKEKGAGNIVYKMVIVIVLIAFVPKIFEGAYKVQNVIINKSVIPKVILGPQASIDEENLGPSFAASVFSMFYYVEAENANKDCYDGVTCHEIVANNLSDLQKGEKLKSLSFGINETDDSDKPLITFEFHGILPVAVGAVIVWILMLYCIDVGTRWAQLLYLQLIAPIPILGYMSPKKDGIFQKWVRQCFTTYLDLFIRVALINVMLLLCHTLIQSKLNGGIVPEGTTGLMNTLVYIVLIMGVMLFAHKVPKMISELFPKSGSATGNFGLKAGERVAPEVARTAGMTLGAGFVGAKGLVSRYANQSKRNIKNLKSGEFKNDLIDYGRSTSNRFKSFGNRFNAGVKYWSAIGDKDARKIAREELKDAKQQYRDAKIEQQSAKAAVQNSRPRSALIAGATEAVAGMARGAASGVQAKDLKGIGKQISQGLKNESKALAKTEKWYNEGGGSTVDRVVTSIEKSLGITTEADEIANEIKYEDELIKENETLIAAEGDVKKKGDDVESRLDSKLNTDSKAVVDADAEKYLKAQIPGIDITSGEKMADLRKKYKAKTESAQAALDEAVKRNGGSTTAPEVIAAQDILRKARTEEDLVKKHTMRAVFTQVLQGNNSDAVAVQRKDMMLQSIYNARRNSGTVRSMRAAVNDGRLSESDFDAFMNGNIRDYDQYDRINGQLQGILNGRSIENAKRKETKRKLEASAKNAAAKANNNTSGN